jgi:hypothetical protein
MMKRSMLVGLILASFTALPAHADELQQQVLAFAKTVSPADFAFTQTMRTERTGAVPSLLTRRYDARGNPAWSLVSIDGKPPTAKQSARTASGKSDTPSYGKIVEWFSAPATRIAATPTHVTYRIAKLPPGAVKLGKHDASGDTSAEAVVNISGPKPFIERAKFFSNTPFRMMMVVKVERFAFNASYRIMPNGKPFSSGNNGEFQGSLMGRAVYEDPDKLCRRYSRKIGYPHDTSRICSVWKLLQNPVDRGPLWRVD